MTRVADALAALRERLAAASPSAAPRRASSWSRDVLGVGARRARRGPDARRSRPRSCRDSSRSRPARRRANRVAYLTGRREFWSLELEVTPDVLVPRPETELLVERALAAIAGLAAARRPRPRHRQRRDRARDRARTSGRCRDGDGCERRGARASRGATPRRLGLANLRFLAGRLVRAARRGSRFDAIASNPPYVAPATRRSPRSRTSRASALVAGDGRARGARGDRLRRARRSSSRRAASSSSTARGRAQPCARCSRPRGFAVAEPGATSPGTSA